MKRSFLFRERVLLVSGLGLIAATYGLVRLAYGLLLPDVQRDLGLGAATAGWVSSGASVSYCLGAVVGFLLAGRTPRALALAATLVAAAGAAGMAAAPGPVVFAIASIVGSAAAGLASPALVRLVDRQVPNGRRARAQAVVNAGTGPGLVAAGVLALVLLPDWRTAWVVSAGFAIVVGAVLLVASSGGPGDRAGAGGGGGGGGGNSRRGGRTTLRATSPDRQWVAAHRGVIALALLFGGGSAVVWTYGRSTLVDAGAPVVVSVGAWIALGIGGAAVTVTSRWTAGLPAATTWTATAGAVAVAVLALGALPDSTTLALVSCVVFGWGYTAATGALITWTAEIDPDRSPAGTSMLFVALVLGQGVGAAAAGMLVDAAGAVVAFAAGAAVTAASAAIGPRVRAGGGARSSGCRPPTPRRRRGERSRRPAGP